MEEYGGESIGSFEEIEIIEQAENVEQADNFEETEVQYLFRHPDGTVMISSDPMAVCPALSSLPERAQKMVLEKARSAYVEHQAELKKQETPIEKKQDKPAVINKPEKKEPVVPVRVAVQEKVEVPEAVESVAVVVLKNEVALAKEVANDDAVEVIAENHEPEQMLDQTLFDARLIESVSVAHESLAAEIDSAETMLRSTVIDAGLPDMAGNTMQFHNLQPAESEYSILPRIEKDTEVEDIGNASMVSTSVVEREDNTFAQDQVTVVESVIQTGDNDEVSDDTLETMRYDVPVSRDIESDGALDSDIDVAADESDEFFEISDIQKTFEFHDEQALNAEHADGNDFDNEVFPQDILVVSQTEAETAESDEIKMELELVKEPPTMSEQLMERVQEIAAQMSETADYDPAGAEIKADVIQESLMILDEVKKMIIEEQNSKVVLQLSDDPELALASEEELILYVTRMLQVLELPDDEETVRMVIRQLREELMIQELVTEQKKEDPMHEQKPGDAQMLLVPNDDKLQNSRKILGSTAILALSRLAA